MNIEKRFFASDNCSKVHPEIIKALVDANQGHAIGYGYDDITNKAIKKIKEVFEIDCEPFFVYNGTGANILAISSLCKPYEAIITAKTAHINHHETGGLERFGGNKIIYIESLDGKIDVNKIEKNLNEIGDEHVAQPRVVSISEPTEFGTVYTLEELKEIKDFCDKNNLFLHIDGARIFNACVFLNIKIKDIFKYCDVLSFGGTKNGLMFGEVVLFNKESINNKFYLKLKNIDFESSKNLSKIESDIFNDFKFIRKQGMQLHSKMRYISAQYLRYFSDDLPYKLAQNANNMAKYLEEKLNEYKLKNGKKNYFSFYKKRETNQLFIYFPLQYYKKLSEEFPFYIWDEKEEIVRFVTSWDNEKEDVDNFINSMKEIVL